MIKLGLYKHYKGNLYEVIGIAKHSETLEEMVVYKSKYGEEALWVRPTSMFEESIEVAGKIVKRFEGLVEDSECPHWHTNCRHE